MAVGFIARDHERAKNVVRRGLDLRKTLPDGYGARLQAADRVLDRLDPAPRPVEQTGPVMGSMTIKLQFGDGRDVRAADYELQPGRDYAADDDDQEDGE